MMMKTIAIGFINHHRMVRLGDRCFMVLGWIEANPQREKIWSTGGLVPLT